MKKLELNQMENLEGGRKISANCGVSLGGALVFGTGAIIAAATGGVGGIAFAMAGSYFGWGMAAWSCS
jgi:hypothetical protein